MVMLKINNCRYALCAGLLVATVGSPAVASAESLTSKAFSLYGDRISFDVYRNDKRVGFHEVTFRAEGDQLVVDSTFELSLRFLGLFSYNYSYKSTEAWQDGHLQSLRAEIDDNGDSSTVVATPSGEGLQLTGPESQEIIPKGLFPTTHWNAGVIGSTQVINTITGQLNDVEMVDKGLNTIQTGNTTRPATHFAYQGELNTEVWYDGDGRWVKMRFPGKDGVMIEYRCQLCGQTSSAERSNEDASGDRQGNGT